MQPRPGALLVTRNFPPLVGGMEKLNFHIHASLAHEYETSLCGPAGSSAFLEKGGAAEAPISPLPIFLLRTLFNAFRIGLAAKPKYILGGSGLVAPLVWIVARAVRAKFVLYLHGLDIVVPSWTYQRFWLPFIRRADQVLVNSANTSSLAVASGVAPERIHVLHPGTELPEVGTGHRARFRSEHGLGDTRLLLSVGRFTRRKGLAEFVQHSLPGILATYPDTKLLIIGDEASNALAVPSGSEKQRIIEAARAAGAEDKIQFMAHCDDKTLSMAYEAADCYVFPVRPVVGDVEGFGMVALEAAAHGLPTVAFSIGGIPDAVAPEPAGYLVESGDYAAFSSKVMAMLARTQDAVVREQCLSFASHKSWAKFGERLRAILAG